MKWIKASERLPEINPDLIFRFEDKSGVYRGYNKDGFIFYVHRKSLNDKLQSEFINTIEWLDESESPQPSAPSVSADNQDFLKYTTEARDKFCMYIKSLDWNTEMITSVDDFLICFDQLKERYAQAQYVKGWVRVEDGLPESNFERFICCLKNGMRIEMTFTRLDGIVYWNSLLGNENAENPVTHWMPLPIPPNQ